MIWLVWAVVAAVVGTAAVVVVTSWPEVAELLQRWLRRNNLTKSSLATAVVVLDRLAVGVRRVVRVTTHAGVTRKVSTEEIDIDDIDDPELRATLQRTGHAEGDVLRLVD
ncbi:hypothetical protein ACFFX1_22320 [Dactylosporangium sucinum]|uniref:Uncharacterized protein n=1 Tax=Dactylosporangium sucinum TaxID=1424081 RepID=A0A917WYH8_9ACTN|nr:hypothetical protein [Dactylosporangium sucinum]GGM45683.1 hypothetical protein GCM10007977_054120 [Dactylosporangium sucinum]